MTVAMFWVYAFGLLAFGLAASAQAQREPGEPPEFWEQWVDPDREVPEGVLYRTFHSRTVGGPVSYLVYLPPGYEEAEGRYPVIYVLHGIGGTQRGGLGFVRQLDGAVRAGRAPACIAVLVNGLRAGMYCDSADGRRPVETAIVQDLIPHVDGAYRTVAGREGRAVEGFSMGGFGAVRLGFKYPELFGAVTSLGGALHDADSIAGGGRPEDWGIGADRRRKIFEYVYGGERDYFQKFSPWLHAEENADRVRGRTAVRLVVGDQDPLLGPNRRFHELLDRLEVAHGYIVVPGARHNPGQLYEGLGEDPFRFYRDAFSRAGR